MSTIAKTPDRINISKKAKTVVDKIDKDAYLRLALPYNRLDLFIFAMALGIDTTPTKLENINPGGFILESAIFADSKARALLYAHFISRLPNVDMLDTVVDKGCVYNMAQEYANTGFEILEDYINTKKDYELIWDLLEELDAQYNENVKE